MDTAIARLRAKTDRELCTLATRQLNRSRKLAGRGELDEAAKGYLSAKALLAVADIPPADRARLERLMHEVRQTIDRPMTAVA